MPGDRRKAAAMGAASRAYNRDEAQGRDIGKGRGCAPWGDIGGSKSGRKAGRHDERKSSAWRSGMGAAPRACVYIAAIYSIFIYIYYLYIYNINIISIYLIIYINIIPFSPFSCNTSVLYVKIAFI